MPTAIEITNSGAPLFLIAGPCAMESREMTIEAADFLSAMCQKRQVPFIFKSSFDKANRTAGDAGRGLGQERGLSVLAEVRQQFNVPVLTDVHWPEQAAAAAAAGVDVLQIPAFLCRQTDLINACAKSGQVINIKKGQFLSPPEMLQVAQKAKDAGAARVLLCERGSSFGYNNLVADMRGLVQMRAAACPIVFDATHSAQLPGAGGAHSGGMRDMVPPLARAAAAVGIDGLFVEAHPNPEKAISDAATQWPLDKMPALLDSILAIDKARRSVENFAE